ncbi:hypothetical protein [Cellulosimicrobium sp. KWT-B]|uniref:hypothetical protein n=1 Tax=Cellulosimicrobium sp. KWT-B TaxID=1981152 RepID=UPI000A31FCD7|nr:hypothetical protein [Cellulosimicrobium sp. KWT-B]
MSRETGSTPTPPDDDFLLRLRRTADDAVPPSTLDLDVVLRSSRRGAQRRRSLAGVAGVVALGLVGTGVVTAGGPGGVRELAREVVTGSPGYEVLVDEPTTVDVAPGVVAVAEPATYLRDDGTYVLDLGLGAWRDGERFLVEYDPAPSAGEDARGLRVLAGDDDDLAALRRGDDAGTLVHDGFQHLMLLQRAGGEDGLVLSVQSSSTSAGSDPSWERDRHQTWVAVAGEPPGATGPTFRLPDAWAGGVFLNAALFGPEAGRVTDVRGVLSSTTYSDGTSNSLDTCGSPLTDPRQDRACRFSYDPSTREVVPVEAPPSVLDRSVLDRLLPVIAEPRDEQETGLRTCLAARGAEPDVLPSRWGLDPSGVDGDAWRQCQIDVSLVSSARFAEWAEAIAAGP